MTKVAHLLITSRRLSKRSDRAHRCPFFHHAALLASCILSVPWPALWHAGAAVAACGVLGMIYSAIVLGRALRQRDYAPVLEDWIWHTILPA